MERGEFPGCGSPTGLESRDPYDIQLGKRYMHQNKHFSRIDNREKVFTMSCCSDILGARMFYNTQDMLWRRKLEEQADLQQAIELQNRRLMGLQLLDVKRNSHNRTLSSGAVISSPTFFNQNVIPSNRSSPEAKEGLHFRISSSNL